MRIREVRSVVMEWVVSALHRAGIVLVSLTLLSGALTFVATAGAFERSVFEPAGYSPFGSFSHPTGIAVNESAGEVLIADGESADVVAAFGLEGGSMLGSLSGTGSETFEFATVPVGVAVDNDPTSASFQDLYVTDFKHNVLDKFRRTGPGAYEYVCQFNGWYGAGAEACHASGGAPLEPFFLPLGVAVDAQGDVYVANYGPEKGVVDEFDAAGSGVTQVKAGEHALLSGHPQGVAVDSGGDLFVRDLEREGLVTEFKRGSLTGGVESEHQITGSSVAIAIEPSTNGLYIDTGSEVAQYLPVGSSGELELSSEFGSGILGGSLGIAIDGASRTTYATDAGNLDVSAFVSRSVIVPDLRGSCTVTAVMASTATLRGEVDPLGTEGAQYTFEYGLAGYEHQSGGTLEGTGFRPVSVDVGGLIPGETYRCRLSTTNAAGLAGGLANSGLEGTFQTIPLLPAVDELPAFATEITIDSAILNGLVNPGNGVTTTYHFAYGREAGTYEHVLPSVGVGNGFAAIPVEQAIPPASLKPNTTYHFALIAHNAAGTVTGHDETFTTASLGTPPETAPVVSTGPAEAITQNTATLTGTAYPENTPTICCFQLGIDTTYGTLIFTGEAGRERGAVHVSQPVASLQPGTTYHYRLECFNAAGTTIGPDRSFTTSTFPQEIFQPATPALVPIPVFPKVKNPVIKHPRKKKKPKKRRHKAKGAGSRARRSAHPRS